jgi:FeS assembly SUF system regulator
MLKLSKLTDYGTLVMTVLAAQPDTMRTAAELAARTHLGAPTVAKLLKRLARGGLVESIRGAHGGYRLGRAPEQITVADIVRVLEGGPIGITECAVHSGGCGIESSCSARANWRLINSAVRHALEAVTLAQMAAPMRAAKAGAHEIAQTVTLSRLNAADRTAAGKV